MDRLKQSFAADIQDLVRKAVEDKDTAAPDGLPRLSEELTEVVSIEFQKVSDLIGVVRINGVSGRGPRYFEVIVKERY
jgi:hypothetical protein